MNDLRLLFFTMLFSLIIVFLAATFSPYFSMKGLIFGVRLDEKYKKDAAIKSIQKTYVLQCTLAFVLITVFTLWYVMTTTSEKALTFMILVSMLGLMGICFVFFVLAHNKIKTFKGSLEETVQTVQKTVIDTAFMEEKKKLKSYFNKLYIFPLLLVLAMIIYTLSNYSLLPEQIPTHWNLLGEADSWQPKSLMTVFMNCFTQVGLLALLFYSSTIIFTTRGKIDPAHYEEGKKNLMRYLKGMGYSFYSITVSLLLTFTLTTISMVTGQTFSIAFMLFGLIIPFVASAGLFITWFKYRKNTTTQTTYSPENEESHWIWGSFYYNPHDPSLFVEKRYGIGWTLNLGTPGGKIIMVLTVVLLIGACILPFFSS